MFSYKSLERILNIKFSVYKHGQCLHGHADFDYSFEYENESYRVTTSEEIDQDKLKLILLLIKQNEQSQPFWIRVFKDLPYLEEEIPSLFRDTSYYQIWLIKGKHISKDSAVLEALLESSEIIQLTSDRMLVLLNDQESLQAEDIIGHFETEVMKVIAIYIGPKVKQLSELKYAYKQTMILEELLISNQQSIVDYNNVLFDRVIHELSSEIQDELLSAYSVEYPVQHINAELLETINGFFKNNLNVTDTANELFLHRNTLIYRLNKITQVTNLDIRNFEDACRLRILLSLNQSKNH